MTTDTHTDEAIAPRAGGGCCPFYHEAVELVGRRWTGAILRVLMDGPLRFSEVSQTIPELSDRLLSERMKELESRGLVTRTVFPTIPPWVDYELTDLGRGLWQPVEALGKWASDHQSDIESARTRFDGRNAKD